MAYGCSLNPQPAPPARDDDQAGSPAASGSSGATTSTIGATASTSGGLDVGNGGGGALPAEGAGGMAGAGAQDQGGAPND